MYDARQDGILPRRWPVIVSRKNWFVAAALVIAVAALVAGAALARAQNRAPASPIGELKAKIAQATRMLAREGIIAASGHVSARIPGTDRVLIGPGYVTRDILTADDIITVDLNAKKVEGKTREPLETEIHTGIYRARPDVMAVVHSHPVHSVAFTITKKPILPVTVHGAIFADGVPTFDVVGHVNTRELGDAMAKVLGSHRAVLLKMHGAVIVGSSVEEAFAASLQLEENAEKQLWAEATGTVEAMTAEEAARSVRQSFGASSIEKRWQYYSDIEKLPAASSR
jgi:L-ribulose-5-phosphate 4-epimerase